ncbi:MAG: transporter substrate-binding protein, partial [Cyanobacteria bacterium J06598_3]
MAPYSVGMYPVHLLFIWPAVTKRLNHTQMAKFSTSNKLNRRRFLGKFVLGTSAAAGASALSTLLNACAPDFAELLDGQSSTETALSDQGSTGASTSTSTGEPSTNAPASNEIKVGILHSLSGTLAISEAPIVDAERLAIAEINAAGGVLGKQLVPVQEDGASDWPTFAEKAEKLIDQNDIAVIFGGLTSSSRKAMLPVVKAKNRLLWYPGAYEGQECSNNIFYAGATANQQIEPAINWMLGNRGKSFFLVSSNARTTHDMVKAQLKAKGGKIAGEAYVPLLNGVQVDMAPVVKDIEQALPDGGIIFNSLLGSHNRAFFQELKSAGLPADKYLVMSVRLSEEEVFQIGREFLTGHYAAWSYFQSIDSPENQK